MVGEDLGEVLLHPFGGACAIVYISCDIAGNSFACGHDDLSQKLGPTGSVNGCCATK